ncbi:MAG TPA: FAD-dependent oxidoreductase [Gaiellaceae bacterium]|jgi:3-phenylpropionate/trans-cinnamate dioxygenase ferredoxin reductase component
MTRRPENIVVVGTGLAGVRSAETLRARGYEGRLTLVGEETHLPYERPALSKELLAGKRSAEQLMLRQPEFFREQRIELLLGRRVEKVAPKQRTALLSDGRLLLWDALVLATGARARHLRGIDAPAGVHYLRTLSDALSLSAALAQGKRLAVVGAGFIGAEVASTAVALGLDVSVIEPLQAPLERVLGAEVGMMLAERYRAQGVDLRLGTGVTGFASGENGLLRALQLSDGSELACDVAVVGVGAEPAGELLGGQEIETDASGRTKHAGIYACGDVASSWRPSLGRRLRMEHWTNAAGQAATVARTILGEEVVHDDVPFFWSDQFGLRLQYVGFASEWDRIEIEEDGDTFSVRYLDQEERLLAALVANRPSEIAALRRELAADSRTPSRKPKLGLTLQPV